MCGTAAGWDGGIGVVCEFGGERTENWGGFTAIVDPLHRLMALGDGFDTIGRPIRSLGDLPD